jgi:hypothetical protein
MLDGAGIVRLIGVDVPASLAIYVSYAEESPDGRRGVALRDLPIDPSGDRLGRVAAQIAGDPIGRWSPPLHLAGGRITLSGDTVQVEYPPGWRGPQGESGMLIEAVTAARWNRYRLGPEVEDDAGALATVRAWRAL